MTRMEFMVWTSVAVGKACMLDSLANVENGFDLVQGRPRAEGFPANARFKMSAHHKKATELTDDVSNYSHLHVCSPALVAFFQRRSLANVEYLPVTILNHQGKVASDEYSIVHPIHLQDALDLKASQPSYNAVKKDQIDSVERLVIDARKLAAGVRVFRLRGFYHPVIIDKALADELEAEGFEGPAFEEPADFRF